MLGNGSNDVLSSLPRGFCDPVTAVYSRHAFAVYPLATQAGAEPSASKCRHSTWADLQAMATKRSRRRPGSSLCQPQQSTVRGCRPPHRAFIASVPEGTLVVLDEVQRIPEPEQQAGSAACGTDPSSSFADVFKARGLAALRVGYGSCIRRWRTC